MFIDILEQAMAIETKTLYILSEIDKINEKDEDKNNILFHDIPVDLKKHIIDWFDDWNFTGKHDVFEEKIIDFIFRDVKLTSKIIQRSHDSGIPKKKRFILKKHRNYKPNDILSDRENDRIIKNLTNIQDQINMIQHHIDNLIKNNGDEDLLCENIALLENLQQQFDIGHALYSIKDIDNIWDVSDTSDTKIE